MQQAGTGNLGMGRHRADVDLVAHLANVIEAGDTSQVYQQAGGSQAQFHGRQ